MDFNTSIKELTALFAEPERYIIEGVDSDYAIHIASPSLSYRRSNDNIELRDERYIITIPTTHNALERIRAVAQRLERTQTSLFPPCEVKWLRMTDISTPHKPIYASALVVTLVDELSPIEVDGKAKELYRAISTFEHALEGCGLYFKELSAQDVAIDQQGLLHPTTYAMLRLGKASDSCAPLRRWLAAESGVEDECDRRNLPTYPITKRDPMGEYLSFGTPHEDRIAVESPEGWGFVDTQRNVVIEPKYLWVESFREGRAVVESLDGWGVINTEGVEVIPAIYESLHYNDTTGISCVKLNARWSYFSYRGEQLTPFTTEYPDEDFRLGVAATLTSHRE